MSNLQKEKEIKVFHVFPGSTLSNFSQSGGSKGIQIFKYFLEENNIAHDNCLIKKKSDLMLLKKLFEFDLSHYSHILIHYPMFPLSLIYIKLKNPKLKIIVRSHNAEFPHWLQHTYLEFKSLKFKRGIICLLTAIRNGIGEYFVGLFANKILAITEWEKDFYWIKRTKKNKLLFSPYYLHTHKRSQRSFDTNSKKRCICLMAPNRSPFLEDGAKNLERLVASSTKVDDWSFCITGDVQDIKLQTNNLITPTGFIGDIDSFLIESRAVAILTNYGFGFKTKILEAANSGCWSLVTEKAFNMIPRNIKKFCIPVDIGSVQSFENALAQCSREIKDFDSTNKLLKSILHNSIFNSFELEQT